MISVNVSAFVVVRDRNAVAPRRGDSVRGSDGAAAVSSGALSTAANAGNGTAPGCVSGADAAAGRSFSVGR